MRGNVIHQSVFFTAPCTIWVTIKRDSIACVFGWDAAYTLDWSLIGQRGSWYWRGAPISTCNVIWKCVSKLLLLWWEIWPVLLSPWWVFFFPNKIQIIISTNMNWLSKNVCTVNQTDNLGIPRQYMPESFEKLCVDGNIWIGICQLMPMSMSIF